MRRRFRYREKSIVPGASSIDRLTHQEIERLAGTFAVRPRMDSWLPSVIRKGQVVSIKVTCDCGKDYPVRDALAGKQVECPDCGALLTVPAASSSPRPEAAGVARGDPSGNSGPWVILGCL